MSYGITTTGFVTKDLSTIITDLTNRAIEIFGADTDLRQTNPLIIYINEIAPDIQQTWNILADMYANFFIISASGTALDQLAVDRGIQRQSAIKATGSMTVTAPAGTIIPGATVFSTSGDSIIYFESTGQVGIGELTESFTSVASPFQYTLANQATGSFGSNQVIVTELVTLTEVGGSPSPGEFVCDYGTPSIIELGDDPGVNVNVTYYDNAATSDAVPIQARTAGTGSNLGAAQINTLVTPVSGVTAVINPLATAGGTDEETDALFRARLIAVPVAEWTEEDLESVLENINGVKSALVDDGEKVEVFDDGDETTGTPNYVELEFNTQDVFRVTQYNDSAGTRTELKSVTTPPTDTDEYSLVTGTPDIIEYTQTLATDDTLTVTYMDQAVGVGVFRIQVVSDAPPLSSTIRDSIDSTTKSSKPFGVSFFVDEPIFGTIGLTITVVLDTGYTLTGVTPSITSGITTYLDTLIIGDSLLHNRLIEIIMTVTGIADVDTIVYRVQNEEVTRGATSTDTLLQVATSLPATIVDEDTVTYNITTDYILTGGEVDWSPGGSEPAQDKKYTVSSYNIAADTTIAGQANVIYIEGTVAVQE